MAVGILFMEPITVTLTDEQYGRIDTLSDENGPHSSKSEAVRELLDDSEEVPELRERIEEQENKIQNLSQRNEQLHSQLEDLDELRQENERLRNEKRTLIADREERQDLREYVGEAKSAIERREERRRKPIWIRIERFIFGD